MAHTNSPGQDDSEEPILRMAPALHPIARSKGTSLQHQVFLVLRDRILGGNPAVGEILPSEDELGRLFSVSRVTVRAAMAKLEADGFVERRQGVGTFVAPYGNSRKDAADSIAQITDLNRLTIGRLLEFDYRRAPADVQAMFGAPADCLFQRAVRLRLKGDIPIFYTTTWMPLHMASTFSREQLEQMSLYQLLALKGVMIHSGSQIVTALLADPIVAPHLHLSVGAPLLQLKREYLTENDELIGYVEILASPGRVEIKMPPDQVMVTD